MRNRIYIKTQDQFGVDDGTESGAWFKCVWDGNRLSVDSSGELSMSHKTLRAFQNWLSGTQVKHQQKGKNKP